MKAISKLLPTGLSLICVRKYKIISEYDIWSFLVFLTFIIYDAY
uniref:Uncharacterized protein n=1 Tax=Rhizophora mucronata TaxID=61149 RepID=A0A2P2N471_RHIMU